MAERLVRDIKPDADAKSLITLHPDRPFNDVRYYLNFDKLCKLGWSPKARAATLRVPPRPSPRRVPRPQPAGSASARLETRRRCCAGLIRRGHQADGRLVQARLDRLVGGGHGQRAGGAPDLPRVRAGLGLSSAQEAGELARGLPLACATRAYRSLCMRQARTIIAWAAFALTISGGPLRSPTSS